LPKTNDPRAQLKRDAALAAVAQIRDGMHVGLGTGSTSAFAIDGIGRRLQAGDLKNIVAVATSRRAAELAGRYGIPLTELDQVAQLDIAIDGADEVDPNCDLIKGAGGAMLLEKTVEQRAVRLVIIVDESKLVSKLGSRFPVPVEVAEDGWQSTRDALAALGCEVSLRNDDHGPFVTDSHNFILDCGFRDGIDNPRDLAAKLDKLAGVRGHGLFLGMASEILVAAPGGVRSIVPQR